MLLEPVRPDILRTGFVFGLLPGWWLGSFEMSEQDFGNILTLIFQVPRPIGR